MFQQVSDNAYTCINRLLHLWPHYNDVIMGAIASLITSLAIVYSAVYSDADQRKHQSSASLAFVWGIHRGQVNSPHKWPLTRKLFPFDDVIMWGKGLMPTCARHHHYHLEKNLSVYICFDNDYWYIEGILPKGPYLPCVSMAGRSLLAGWPRYI